VDAVRPPRPTQRGQDQWSPLVLRRECLLKLHWFGGIDDRAWGDCPMVEEFRGPSRPVAGCDFGVAQRW
jgi:hypothetical protein